MTIKEWEKLPEHKVKDILDSLWQSYDDAEYLKDDDAKQRTLLLIEDALSLLPENEVKLRIIH